MIRKTCFCLMLCALASSAVADRLPLDGFSYAAEQAPTGNEWQSPQQLALNKEQPHAWFFSFQDVASARKILPENSTYWKSLNGTWKFHFAKNPDERPAKFFETNYDDASWDNVPVPLSWNIYGIQKDGSLKYGVPIYVNQPVIFYHQLKVDDWKKGVMRTPPTNWTTYTYRNEVGSFRRTFEVPENWDGREVYINFDGVDSFFYLWINGHYVGFSKNSRNAACFDITKFLQKGSNVIAAEVYRSSDGSFLEAQDMFRLPGIFRTVALYSTPKVQIRDLVAKPDLDANYRDGEVHITAALRNLTTKDAKDLQMQYSLFANDLYGDNTTPTDFQTMSNQVKVGKNGGEAKAEATLKVTAPRQWTAESPYRYTLVGQLKDKKGNTIETVSCNIGFCKVEIKNTPASQDEFGLAGRYYYINGKTLKLKGVNRHESSPSLGRAITRQQMEEEIMMMKRANINHVRTSHYPYDPYWYYLCNKYGIYLEAEANTESHEYYYGEASLSHPVEWRAAHVARMMEMAHALVNDPCVVIWSLGNEAGPGKNFKAAYDTLKTFDKSRPVQYERNNDIVDMGSNQYPSIASTYELAKGNSGAKYPFHISEYAHSMGNAEGNLVDYWDAIESTNFICGGAIWDWVDQSMYNYTKDGKRYLAYGGDFGDTPNDGQFVMNGIVFGDLEPKPQYYEVKKVYQYIGVKAIDAKKGQIEVFNKNYYTDDLSDYDLRWSLYADGQEVKSGTTSCIVTPRQRKNITLDYGNVTFDPAKEYFLKVQFCLKQDMPWAKRGFVQAEEQMPVQSVTQRPSIASLNEKVAAPKVSTPNAQFSIFQGKGFEAKFDMTQGTIYSLAYNGKTIISDGNGPKLDAFRAFTNNDNWAYPAWFKNGLHNLKHKVLSSRVIKKANGETLLVFTVESQAPYGSNLQGDYLNWKKMTDYKDRPFGENDFKFTTNQVWTIYPDGSIELQSSISSNQPNLVLPRLGYAMKVDQSLPNFTYYGRGPIDNYPDRKTGQFIEQYTSTVAAQFENFPKPQDMANHQDTRWCALTANDGNGAAFISGEPMAVSALQYSAMDLTMANHPYELPAPGDTYLHLDLAVTGLGGNSCGQGGPLKSDRVLATPHTFSFLIRPVTSAKLTDVANVSLSGAAPLSITRDRKGIVSVTASKPNATILYTLGNSKKVLTYSAPIDMHNGGVITTWEKSNPSIQSKQTFTKVEFTPIEVIYASSVESGEGNAEHLTDGDPSTYWHTMYSVTVANYPHWVDFDCGDAKMLKGFTYLPRQDSGNGNIKGYKIQVSQDAKTWSEPIVQGQFERNQKEKRVLFPKAVKARYIRFTALSSQDGQDFATGAEFSVISE